MKRIAFYGGSFDPVHIGHFTIAENITEIFELDEFVLIPAFHAPHKARQKPTSEYHRFAMLCLSSNQSTKIKVSTMELEVPEKPYTIETLTKLKKELPDDKLFFVMGADSWQEVTTWRDWEKVLAIVNIIVVTRPNYKIGFSHVTDEILDRIIDLRAENNKTIENKENRIFITNAVQLDISATQIRKVICKNEKGWKKFVHKNVAKYITKYGLYKDTT